MITIRCIKRGLPSICKQLSECMKVIERKCKKEFIYFIDGQPRRIQAGLTYTTSEVNEAPATGPEPVEYHVVVFTSSWWVSVPLSFFEEGGDV